MIETFKQGDKWLLVVGIHTVGGNGIHGSRSASSRAISTFELCWTGTRWAPNNIGMKFDSREDALSYLEEHREEMLTPN